MVWVEKFLRYHKDRNDGVWRHPTELGKAEMEQYLTFLAVDQRVSASTQNQAFSALLFLYKKVPEIELSVSDAGRAKRGQPALEEVSHCGCRAAEFSTLRFATEPI